MCFSSFFMLVCVCLSFSLNLSHFLLSVLLSLHPLISFPPSLQKKKKKIALCYSQNETSYCHRQSSGKGFGLNSHLKYYYQTFTYGHPSQYLPSLSMHNLIVPCSRLYQYANNHCLSVSRYLAPFFFPFFLSLQIQLCLDLEAYIQPYSQILTSVDVHCRRLALCTSIVIG